MPNAAEFGHGPEAIDLKKVVAPNKVLAAAEETDEGVRADVAKQIKGLDIE